jgi:heat shock protein HtpX
MFRRLFFFFLTNIMIISLISILTSVFGVNRYLTENGLNYAALLSFCLIWGMVGSFISLLISKWSAKTWMQLQEINMSDRHLGWIVDRVHEYARAAGITSMPEVFIYESTELNAFATGPSKNNSLVAVSTGLINTMTKEEVEGVLGHEVAHIANGDMVTMALLQGVINAFVMFFARVVAFAIDSAMRKSDDEGEGLGRLAYPLVVMVFELVFGFLGALVTAYFSRFREFRADEGGAKLAGKQKMIAGLQALADHYDLPVDDSQPALATMKISGRSSWLQMFSTHPPLSARIQALRNAAN